MSSDDQFTAKGAAAVGFQINAEDGPINIGAELIGENDGVVAHGKQGVGVRASSDYAPGVFATSHHFKTSAVIAVASGSESPAVDALSKNIDGIGVWGRSTAGRGGVFQAGREGFAQVGLVPHMRPLPDDVVQVHPVIYREEQAQQILPETGNVGDLILYAGPNGEVGLWICVWPNIVQGSGNPAAWRQVLLGEPVKGTHPVDKSTPIDDPNEGQRPVDP